MRRILFVQDSFQPPGGAHLVAAWMLQALTDDFDVTVLAWRSQDWEAVDRFYGTTLKDRSFSVRVPPRLLHALVGFDPDPQSIQGINYLLRWCKRIRADYDLCVTGSDMEADFGTPGIQYCHYAWLLKVYERYGRGHGRPTVLAMLRGRARPWMVISDYSFERMKHNLTLVNSDWTRDVFRAGYGIDPLTVYPPAPGTFPDIPWDRREDGFVCLGLLAPAKRIDWMIHVLDRVRVAFPRLTLHIAGTRKDDGYYRRLSELVRARAGWVTLHEDLSRANLLRLLAHQRFGLHARVDEHFGIAVADMVRAGCLPFVHASGGQVEIVMREPSLIYDSADDAVRRITAILEHPERQDDLRRRLAGSADRFTPRRFTDRIRELARQRLDAAAPATP